MKKQVIKLMESDLHKIIKESVNNILKESKKMSIKDVFQELLWACEQNGMTNELYAYLRNFEKEHGWDFDNETYQHEFPISYHNCSFSPSAERTPNL